MATDDRGKTPFLKKVGANLYRTDSGIYYLLVKRGGKQFRRSLKTSDFALAKRRLREFQEKAASLSTRTADKLPKIGDSAECSLASRKPQQGGSPRSLTSIGKMIIFGGYRTQPRIEFAGVIVVARGNWWEAIGVDQLARWEDNGGIIKLKI